MKKHFNQTMTDEYQTSTSQNNLHTVGDPTNRLGSSRQQLMTDEMSQELTYLAREAPLDGGESTLAAPSYSQLAGSSGAMMGSDEAENVTALDERSLSQLKPDNVEIGVKAPLKQAGFLVSFMVDARGGAMRGCRHSGVRVIIPANSAPQPMRITCRYLRRERLVHPPPLMEGEACASRIMEVGPAGAKFLGPVVIEVPHFASLRNQEREIIILRSDNGQVWREHLADHVADERLIEAIVKAANDLAITNQRESQAYSDTENLDPNGMDSADESLSASLAAGHKEKRLTRIVTDEFPQYFAIISRVRQQVHSIGPEGRTVSSDAVPKVQTIFTEGALTKRIKIGLQAQIVPDELLMRTFGSLDLITFSPVVTIEPRRRKFHCPIRLKIPLPAGYESANPNNLRLLCSITGGSNRANWEDVTGSTPLSINDQCLVFTTTVSARFWLANFARAEHRNEAPRCAEEIWRQLIRVPFMVKFVIFAKRGDTNEASLRVFCLTDDKEDERSLEQLEHYEQVAKSRDVEILEGQRLWLEFAGNLVPYRLGGSMRHLNARYWAPQPVTEQLSFAFRPFEQNRLAFVARLKEANREPGGRIAFMRDSIKWLSALGRSDPRALPSEDPRLPVCTLGLRLPPVCVSYDDVLGTPRRNSYHASARIGDLSLAELASSLDGGEQLEKDSLQALEARPGGSEQPEWVRLAPKLGVPRDELELIADHWPKSGGTYADLPALGLLLHWRRLRSGFDPEEREQELARALIGIGRPDLADRLGIRLVEPARWSSRDTSTSRDVEMTPLSRSSNENLVYANAAMLDRQQARARRTQEAEAALESERRRSHSSRRQSGGEPRLAGK